MNMDARPDGRRWMGVGQSSTTEPRTAAAQAARSALSRSDSAGTDPKLLIVFSAITYDPALVRAGVRDVVGRDVPVIGCTTRGEICNGGANDGTVVVAAIGGPGFAVTTAAAEDVRGRQREAGVELGQSVTEIPGLPHRVLVLLTDGLVREQEQIVRGCYSVLGASVPLFGGSGADGWRMKQAYLLCGDRVLTNAVVAATIHSEAPLSVGVRHGFRTVGEPMIVTGSQDGRIQTVDDRPALDVYLERLGAPPEAYRDKEALMRFALPRPLGLQRRNGVDARNVSTQIDLEGRSLGGGGNFDHGGLVWAMTGDEQSILAATDAACQEALAGLGGREPVGLLTISCAAIRAILDDDALRRDNARLAKWAEQAPFAGFYAYGEIARARGIHGFHNQTLTVLALG
ncbi:FIST signal transduction protein [Kutzneria sp. 744]|uniref:FIST signal transduction protein n=1 Tax=Kutzneria sp. (strain 744) TaxID=345341 RepID=UPI0003EEC406|nr:FIST N-terminal domain-containing protein [Kutzneria sp. 744]EWM11383.1 PE-PGRS family protein [Kutzneria sp. 744]